MQLRIRLLKSIITVDLNQLAQLRTDVKAITVFQNVPTTGQDLILTHHLITLQICPIRGKYQVDGLTAEDQFFYPQAG